MYPASGLEWATQNNKANAIGAIDKLDAEVRAQLTPGSNLGHVLGKVIGN